MLHFETVEPDTLELLRRLMDKPYLSTFCLVGGTSLSLQFGHRKSIDLDLFSEIDFDGDKILENLGQDFHEIEVLTKMKGTLLTRVQGVKVDFLRFNYPAIRPIRTEGNLRLLTPEDIAPMKLDAVAGRGKKKDFYDLYFLLEKMTLQEMLNLHHEKFKLSTTFHIVKSLTYFEDAEEDDPPVLMKRKITWSQVKKKILAAVASL
ncbi:MAG: nucleotidyl transferase AbiEii/AbiGii toxin family protein [Saprospiraceae bacterium]